MKLTETNLLLAIFAPISAMLLVFCITLAQQIATLTRENNRLVEMARRENTDYLKLKESYSNNAVALRRAYEKIDQYLAELNLSNQELVETHQNLESTQTEKLRLVNELNWTRVLNGTLREDTSQWALWAIDVYLYNQGSEIQKRDDLFMATNLVKYLANFSSRNPNIIEPQLVRGKISEIDNQIGSNVLLRLQLTSSLSEASDSLDKQKGSA